MRIAFIPPNPRGIVIALFALICVAVLVCGGALVVLRSRASGSRRPVPSAPVAYAGLRASTYGINPFPSADEWDAYAQSMETAFPGSVGSFVWIVGNVNGNAGRQTCVLNFPLEEPVSMATGFPIDGNEAFLELCDRRGYSVWLQVESGDADPVELCRATLSRYRNHPSVRGFGVDAEWHKTGGTDGWGTRVTDDLARRLVAAARSVNRRYEVFLKHWDADWMPPTEREGLVFVNDSQGHADLGAMESEFADWALRFAPRPVAFQIGYDADRDIWGAFDDPVADLGSALARAALSRVASATASEAASASGGAAAQEISVVWVDFTLRSVMADRSTLAPDSATLGSK